MQWIPEAAEEIGLVRRWAQVVITVKRTRSLTHSRARPALEDILERRS